MALKLEAKHRWAVSGTPIGRGKLDDLYGLLLFLRLTPPFSDKAWFRQCFASVSDNANIGRRIHHLLGNVFWRSTASFDVVRTQMGVPAQIEKKNYLKFSSVEKHFYERQLEETLGLAGDVADQEKARKRKATNNSLDMLVQSLHKLRAACCHPQVGSSGIVGTTRKNNHTGASAGSVSTRVLTMEQVLDRLIDDARNKCEEALRVVIFHTNPMASISRLKVEAKNNHGVSTIKESDEFLLAQSSKLYLEALKFADENAIPCLATGAVVLNGSPGFRLSHKELHYSKTKLDWQIQHQGDNVDVLWASFEFTGQSKKMKQVRIRSLACVPESLQNEGSEDFIWNLKSPKDCVLQISNAALGGEFQDILSLSLPKPTSGNEQNDWVVNDVSTIYKSKSWRLVIKSFHPEAEAGDDTDGATQQQQLNYKGFYAGMEVELLEPTIATDSLQRLHALHNAAISLRELSQVMVEGKCGNSRASKSSQPPRLPLSMSRDEMEKKAQSMDEECDRIERYHLEYARGLHSESRRRLEQAMNVRKDLEHQLLGLSKKKDKRLTFWDCTWWNDLVAHVEISGSLHEKASLCEKAQEILDNFTQERGEWHKTKKTKPFPAFYDINGLQVALTLRFDEEQSKLSEHDKYMKSVLNLSTYPSDSDVYENRNCQVCKLEWHMTGPKCRHCIMGDKLREIVPDGLTKAILDGIWKWSRVNRSGVRSSNSMKEIVTRANKFFETLEAAEKESNMASKMWRFHLDLLNVVDELHSCKTPMRLLQEGENISSLTEEQRNSIVVPVDVVARYYEHDAKQATALANLRHSKHTLQYLKNLSTEQADNNSLGASPDKSSQDSSTETCQICLSEFDAGDKAVLKCGHCYHLSPCLEKLKKRSGSVNTITCPLRCRATTKYEEVLIASNKRKDDGTQSRRKVEGSWGTKVTAIVGDLLGVADLGEKSIVFSMWEEMLDIMEEALTANGIKHARATSLQNIGEATKEFRAPNCFVLLLNVKNSAEGLTLIEANHVFMIEPLLNYGLDSQARARCHRIGQVRQTYLHRYLITDTIEEKIDGLRIQHQEDQLEDAITEGRKCSINAGGVDGGFSSPEELMDILKLK